MDGLRKSSPLRWVLFFPASVLAAIGAYLGIRIVLLLQGFLGGIGDSVWLYFVLNEASHLAFGYLFVAVATAMVPSRKSVVLILQFCIISIIFSIFTIRELLLAEELINYVDAVGLASAILGGGYYLYQYIDNKVLLFWGEESAQ